MTPPSALTEARAHPSQASELLVDLPRSRQQHNGAGRASHGPAARRRPRAGDAASSVGTGTVGGADPSSTAQNVTPEELPTLHGLSDRRRHRAVLWAIAALLVILGGDLVLVYKPAFNNSLAQAKAHRVEALYAAHGLTVRWMTRTLISILGTNGGSVCASPTSALTKAMQDLSLANGGATVGIRPIQESQARRRGRADHPPGVAPSRSLRSNEYL